MGSGGYNAILRYELSADKEYTDTMSASDLSSTYYTINGSKYYILGSLDYSTWLSSVTYIEIMSSDDDTMTYFAGYVDNDSKLLYILCKDGWSTTSYSSSVYVSITVEFLVYGYII